VILPETVKRFLATFFILLKPATSLFLFSFRHFGITLFCRQSARFLYFKQLKKAVGPQKYGRFAQVPAGGALSFGRVSADSNFFA
jgi:hypothetical protein